MDLYQKAWMIILIPIFLLYGFVEIRRGWKIIKYKEDSYNLAIQIRIWLIKQFTGNKKSKDYEKYLKQDKTYLTIKGSYSFVGGIISLAVSIFWLYLLIRI
jgi:hypothetical protein